jgi:hypothetical protein
MAAMPSRVVGIKPCACGSLTESENSGSSFIGWMGRQAQQDGREDMDLVVVPGRQTIDVNPQSPNIPSSLAK